jgi:hypothetical protein
MQGVFQMSDYVEEARMCLNELRKGSCNYRIFLMHLRNQLTRGGITLEDIGSSDVEIEELRLLGCKVAAVEWLRYLRSGAKMYNLSITCLYEELSQSGLTPEDIGSTDEEISQLRIQGCKLVAREWLDDLRRGIATYDLCISHLRKEIAQCSLALEDIGTSDAELTALKGTV